MDPPTQPFPPEQTLPPPGRRGQLRDARARLHSFPAGEFHELAGRSNVIWSLLDYNKVEGGAATARHDVPFLFKAFETGQMRPPRAGTKAAEAPRASTIHEYLDWTFMAAEGADEDDLDFGGFRTVLLIPRFRPAWPPPGAFEQEHPKGSFALGAPRCPLPQLMPKSKPVSAATVRLGPDFMEVPFFATQETHRNQGFGRALLQALEDLCRALGVPCMLLCSTDDQVTRDTWAHLGFSFTSPQQLAAMGVGEGDLLHMDNTVQMHKQVQPPPAWRSLVIRHESWAQRVYFPAAPEAPRAPAAAPLVHAVHAMHSSIKNPALGSEAPKVLATGQLAPTASFPVPTPATDGKPEADPRPKNGLTGPHALSLQGLSHVSSTQQHPEGHRSLQEGYREQQHPAAAKPAARLGPVYDLHVGGKRERSGAYEPVKRVRKPVVWEPPIGSALLGGSVGCHSHAADGALMT